MLSQQICYKAVITLIGITSALQQEVFAAVLLQQQLHCSSQLHTIKSSCRAFFAPAAPILDPNLISPLNSDL